MPVYGNGRGQTVESSLSHQEALALVAKASPDSWLWYWLHKYAKDMQTPAALSAGSAIQYLCDTFVTSAGYGLSRPKLRVHFMDKRFVLMVGGKNRTILFKAGHVDTGTRKPRGNQRYLGCFVRNSFRPSDVPLDKTDQLFLRLLYDDPREFILDCSRDMGMCCFCGAPLEDETSKKCGYGATCAKRMGLPWLSDEAYLEKAPSFAKVHTHQASQLCDAVRQNPTDPSLWAIYSDWLQEHGLPPFPEMKHFPLLPRRDSGGGPIRVRETPKPWIRKKGLYCALLSALPREKPCPRCGDMVCQNHVTERQADMVALRHPCGAHLLVIGGQ